MLGSGRFLGKFYWRETICHPGWKQTQIDMNDKALVSLVGQAHLAKKSSGDLAAAIMA